MILDYQHYYLVGIKGVAMTSMAQLLMDAGKDVRGSDVEEEFVTQKILDKLGVEIDFSFETQLPAETECVIFTSAHQAESNPQVKMALAKNLPTFSQAEAVAELFNQKRGLAVCGVGGKSTTSAMIAWILEKTGRQPSYSVGVGEIPGLDRTGRWRADSPDFVIEADEYVTNPSAGESGEKIIPRFSYLKPAVTICTNLKFDHPDVYQSLEDTRQAYDQLFDQTEEVLIINQMDLEMVQGLPAIQKNQPQILTFGKNESASAFLKEYKTENGGSAGTMVIDGRDYGFQLKIPGSFNVLNAMAAVLATREAGVEIEDALTSLADFNSTKRRFEYIGEKNGVKYYDDYAHHPHEVAAVISTIKSLFPDRRVVIAFQSHTYSRTKKFFDEFVESFLGADEVVMIDIFSSAREKADPSVSSTQLCQHIQEKLGIPAKNLQTIQNLADYCQQELNPGDVLMTVGAGDIYQVHEMI